MLTVTNSAVLIVDVQGKLAQLMWERDRLFKNLGILIQGARVLDLPIVWAEQNPEGLGPTVPEVAKHLDGLTPIPKFSFSCCGEPALKEAIIETGRRHILVAGIETHICVFQTIRDLIEDGYQPQVVADAVSSRFAENKEIGLERVRAAGGRITSVESLLFELLGEGKGERFKSIVNIVK